MNWKQQALTAGPGKTLHRDQISNTLTERQFLPANFNKVQHICRKYKFRNQRLFKNIPNIWDLEDPNQNSIKLRFSQTKSSTDKLIDFTFLSQFETLP